MGEHDELRKLAHCPFCGGDAKLSNEDCESGYTAFVYVYCRKCGSKSSTIKFSIVDNCGGVGSEWRKPYEDRAIKIWNTRYSDPPATDDMVPEKGSPPAASGRPDVQP
jgi:hypothetical protein